jgi:sigma-B regulation protein RsbU (phosphoserine phosphatase)
LPRSLLIALGVLFAAASIFYAAMWILFGSRGVTVELGFDNKYLPSDQSQLVLGVAPGSPAASAGLKAGDHIVSIFGRPLQGEDSLTNIWAQHRPGDTVQLTVVRSGNRSPIILDATFRASGESSAEAGVATHVGQGIVRLFPLAFLSVGLALLFLRPDDRNAWLVALMFGWFIAVPEFSSSFQEVPSQVRTLAMAYRAIFNNLASPLFYFFFATFPERSPLDRRVPWLKWAGLLIGALLAAQILISVDNGKAILGLNSPYWRFFVLIFSYGMLALGFISLIWSSLSITSPDARRKIRVILWGTLVGVVPASLAVGASDFFGFHITLPVGATIVALLWLFPLSFAYAVVKHRVLEIPVLLRRGARYLLVQRGFLLLLLFVSAGVTIAFALFFARYLQSLTDAAVPGAIGLGTIFGTLLLWTGTRVHHDVARRIDRAFFRSAYDARVILEDLVDKTRVAMGRTELAALLEHHLNEALQPSWLTLYLESGENQLSAIAGDIDPQCQVIPANAPALEELARRGKPWDVTEEGPVNLFDPLCTLESPPDCLVPILGRDDRMAGLIVLGLRRSEEPYSAEDKHLLALAASQTGVAIESIRLGEKIAERIEAERRAAQEMEFARQVQTKLFPQKLPRMRTLEYTGGCIPAKTVGGDYYDFLELRPGRLGIVLADIAGKGVPGALLMANLQANLRSQYAMAVDDLPRLLASVNRLFFENTDEASYATMFFADYNDATGLLRYSNCGHLPPLLVSAVRTKVERLQPTCTVLGMFDDWHSKVAEVSLVPGDTLVLYTDGITEAENRGGEEFSESRLIETVRDLSQLPVEQLKDRVVDAVRQFSAGEQNDDITLVVARCLA